MRCCDVERLWDEMREGVEPQREHVLAHLRGCPECQEIYRENAGIAYCLTCLPPVDPPQSLVPKILDHIKAGGQDRVARLGRQAGLAARAALRGLPPQRHHRRRARPRRGRGDDLRQAAAAAGPRPDPLAGPAVGQRHDPELLPHLQARSRAGRHQRALARSSSRRCAPRPRSRPARSAPTAGSPSRSASRARPARSGARWPATRCPSSIPATASSTRTASCTSTATGSR